MIFNNVYNPAAWYWGVGNGPVGQVFSSAAASFIPDTDPAYVEWLTGNVPTTIDTIANLMAVLAVQCPAATPYGAFVAGGLNVTSTSTPSINGVYAIDPASQVRITTEASYDGQYNKFTTGGTTNLPWQLQNGSFVEFPTVAIFLSFGEAVGQVIAAADIAAAQGNAMPSANVTVP